MSEQEPKPRFTFNGRDFDFIKDRRNKTRVYRAQDGLSFLRLGPENDIHQEASFHKRLIEQGYPVPALIEEGESKPGEAYYLEASAGEKMFGQLFKRDFEEQGAISEETYSTFVEIIRQYLEAQESNPVETKNWESVFIGTHFDFLLDEMPDKKEKIMKVWEKVMEDLKDVPFVLCHGDFNAFNVLPGGVIDFETPFDGPLGYDLISAVANIGWFPRTGDSEMLGGYSLSKEQNERLLALAPATMEHFGALFVIHSCWRTVRMQRFPKLQAWRYRLFWEAVDVYLAGGSVYEWWKKMPTVA